MLVGDRGRVIPFRHFKGIALSVCLVSFLLLVALLVMVILYIGQGRKLASLESEIEDIQVQNSKLRDEKDLYLTKLMLTQKQEKAAAEKPRAEKATEPAEAKQEVPEDKVKAETKAKPVAAVKKKAAPPKPPAPKVQWNADIRRFSVSYDVKQEVLKAQFRVYNTSKPKRRLSGRSVIVFKVQDDPPVKWMPVPRVQLNTGEPSGNRGQSFRVRNYMTMKFRAYRQKTPVLFNTATVYVFGEDGKMLASKDFAFKIKTPPPPPKKQPAPSPPAVKKEQPVPPRPAEKKEQPAPAPPAVKNEQPAPITAPPATTPVEEKAPETAPAVQESGGAEAPDPVPEAERSPAPEPSPGQPEQETVKPADIVDTPPPGEPAAGASDIQPQTETPSDTDTSDTAPQPKVEGETR